MSEPITTRLRARAAEEFEMLDNIHIPLIEAADVIDGLVAALMEACDWIANWSPDFVQDEEWPATRAKIEAALAKAAQ